MKERSYELKNQLPEIERLSGEIEAFGEAHDFPMKTIFEINVSLDELLTNIISYGYEDSAEHTIEVTLRLDGSQLEIIICDDGTPFNPLQVPPPDLTASLEDKPIGGLGLHLVRKMMNNVHYQHKNGKNCLHLIKEI